MIGWRSSRIVRSRGDRPTIFVKKHLINLLWPGCEEDFKQLSKKNTPEINLQTWFGPNLAVSKC